MTDQAGEIAETTEEHLDRLILVAEQHDEDTKRLADKVADDTRWRKRFVATLAIFIVVVLVVGFAIGRIITHFGNDLRGIGEQNLECNTVGSECYNRRIEDFVTQTEEALGEDLDAIVRQLVIILNNVSEAVGLPPVDEQIDQGPGDQ